MTENYLGLVFRTALAAVAILLAVGVGPATAAAESCDVIGTDGEERSCTLSERIGKCGWEAWDSWKSCVDRDGNGSIDVTTRQYAWCNFMGAIDLAGCGVEVPIGLILD
jgi:hypothetical protein